MVMEQLINYPLEIKPLSKKESAEIYKHLTGPQIDYVRIGPSGCLQFSDFMNAGPEIYNMELRSSDVFVVTFPKSGTTWTQELVWLIGNDLDYKKAADVTIKERFPFIEFLPLSNNPQLQQWRHANNIKKTDDTKSLKNLSASITEILTKMPSPRFIKSHLPISLLPPTLLDTAKVVYVARDPRDVAASFYCHYQMFKMFGFTGDIKTYWKLFLDNQVIFAPYFPHIKEAWEKRKHPNMLFLFYEELSKDLPAVVRRVAQFLEKPITEEQVHRLCDHLHINNFRKNKSVNNEDVKELGLMNENQTFIRKGKVGGWREYFDEEMTAQAERWIEDNLRGTDLSFPQRSKE